MPVIDPNYFRPGAQFPPDGDSTRQSEFNRHRALYNNTNRAYALLNRTQRVSPASGTIFEGLDGNEVSYPKYRVNMFRKISNFWKDLLFAFPPVVDAQVADSNRDIKPIIEKTLTAALKVAIDTSRFGTGVYMITSDLNDEIQIEAIETPYWFPVVDVRDHRKVIGDIIVVPYNSNPESPQGAYGDRALVSRYIVGAPATRQTFQLEGTVLKGGSEVEEGSIVEQRACVTVVNGYEIDHYGESDYPDLIDPVSEINRRLSGTSTVLDKHTSPHLVGPESVFGTDPAGTTQLSVEGNFFPLNEEDHAKGVYYLEWDARLEANKDQMDRALQLFYTLSNTSAAALGINEGNAGESGAALRKLLYSSFLRLSGLRRAHENAIIQVINKVFPRVPVTVTWSDPFLDGALEEASAEEIRLRSGISTPAQSIARLDQTTSAEADRIARGAASNPTLNQGVGEGNGSGMGAQRGQSS